MFEKLYKEANDELQINSELKNKLLQEAAKADAKTKRKLYFPIYKYGLAVAAVLVIGISLKAMPFIEDNIVENTSVFQSDGIYTQAPVTTQKPEQTELPVDEGEEMTTENPITESRAESNMVAKSVPEKTSSINKVTEAEKSHTAVEAEEENTNSATVQLQTEPQIEQPEMDSDKSELTQVPEDKAKGITTEGNIENSPKVAAENGTERSSGGGGSSGKAIETVDVALEDYDNHFGVNIENLSIPSGMIMTSGKTVTAIKTAKSDYELCNHTVEYEGSGKKISVTLVVNSSGMDYTLMQDDGEAISGGKMFEVADESYEIYKKNNETGIIISTYGLSYDEAKDLAGSI